MGIERTKVAIKGSAKVTAAATSTVVVAENGSRYGIEITNDSDEVIYLGLGVPAVLNQGIRLNAAGGNWSPNAAAVWTGAINAISTSGGKNLCVAEY